VDSTPEQSKEMAQDAINGRAESIINENIAAFKQNIAATIEYELVMIKRETREGDDFGAEYHKLMLSIYQSILERV